MVTSPGYYTRGPRFDSQHTHGGSQPSVAMVLGKSTALFWLLLVCHAHGTTIYAGKRPTRYPKFNKEVYFIGFLFFPD